MISLLNLDPSSYVPSALHGPDRTFRETNCYVDIWIELLHAQSINPASIMAFACTADFEGDQWTFLKPPPEELFRLYGIDVHEMQLYRPLLDHAVEQLTGGRTITVEVDSFYLPDTTATSYRRTHTKSSIAIEAVDVSGGRLRYFHNTGYYEVSGEDFDELFRLRRNFSDDVLPPYVEIVRFDAGPRLEGLELRRAVREMIGRQLARLPKRNPWSVFGERLGRDLPGLLRGTNNDYHAYAFATVRQAGAAFELLKSFVEWMGAPDSNCAAAATGALERQVAGAKTMLFKLARQRAFDPTPLVTELAADWDITMRTMECLARATS